LTVPKKLRILEKILQIFKAWIFMTHCYARTNCYLEGAAFVFDSSFDILIS